MTISPSAPWSFFLDIPQEDDRGDDDPVQVLAVSGRYLEQAGRDVIDLIGIGLDLDGARQVLLSREVGRLEPWIDQRLELGIVGPAEPGLGAVGAERAVERRRQHV